MKTVLKVIAVGVGLVAIVVVLYLALGGAIQVHKVFNPTPTTKATNTATPTPSPTPRNLMFFSDPQNVYYDPELSGRVVGLTSPYEAVTLLSRVKFVYDGRKWLMVQLDDRKEVTRGWILITEKKHIVRKDEGSEFAYIWNQPLDHFELENTAGGLVLGTTVQLTGKTNGMWTEIVSPFKYEYVWIAAQDLGDEPLPTETPSHIR